MKIRTVALALALVFGVTGIASAKARHKVTRSSMKRPKNARAKLKRKPVKRPHR